MNLSKKEIRQMRRDGEISSEEYLRLLKADESEEAEAPEPEEEDKTSRAIERLADVVEQIGRGLGKEEAPHPDIRPLLVGINTELKALTVATSARKKQWTFTPEYDNFGRIEKVIVE